MYDAGSRGRCAPRASDAVNRTVRHWDAILRFLTAARIRVNDGRLRNALAGRVVDSENPIR